MERPVPCSITEVHFYPNFCISNQDQVQMAGAVEVGGCGVPTLPPVTLASSRRYLMRGRCRRRQLLLDNLAQGVVLSRAGQVVAVDEKAGRPG